MTAQRLALSIALGIVLCARVAAAQAPPGAIVWDTFTGPDGTTLGSHPPEVSPNGGGWIYLGGGSTSPILQSGWAKLASAGGGHQPWAVNAGYSDVTVSADFVGGSARRGGLVVRAAEATLNYLLASVDGSNIALYRVQNNAFTPIGSATSSIVAGQQYRLEVRTSGTQIQLYLDGALKLTVMESFQQTGTRHGISWNDTDPSTKFDRFSVVPGATSAVVLDSFLGTNGTSLISHAPEIKPAGAAWAYAGLGTSGVRTQGNRAELSSQGSGHQPWAIDSGKSDVTVAADFIGGDLRLGSLVFRSTSGANYLELAVDGSDLIFLRMVNGDRTVITRTGVGFQTGLWYRLEVRATGSQLTAFVNGVQRLTTTSTFQQSATKHGIAFHSDDYYAQFDNFAVVPAPSITGLSLSSAPVGGAITISGSNFGAAQGTSSVSFNGAIANVTSWSATSIVAIVPPGASLGPVTVTVNGVTSNGVAFTPTAAPSISSLTPNSGAGGTSVTIAGSNFGATQGASTVKFNGTAAAPTSWSATSIVATAPIGVTAGPVTVTVAGVASSGATFTVPAPYITQLSATSAAVGSTVTITGTSFGTAQGSGSVTFNGTTATSVSSWSTTSITLTVPVGATTGDIRVWAGGQASNGVPFSVLPSPTISSLSPTSGPIGATVTITGTNFGSSQGASSVKFNGTTASVASWNATSIVATVPSGASTGPVTVTVSGVNSSGVTFTVTPPPVISSVSPGWGAPGGSVTIAGTNFGASASQVSVRFNGVASTGFSWSPTSITATIPAGATSGPVVVTVSGVASAGSTFQVLGTPTVSSLSPTTGGIGASVTISGSNFGSAQSTSLVKFNGVTAPITSWSASSIVATVPAGATSGPVTVTVASVASAGSTFTLITTPTISSVTPSSAAVTGSVTIAGSNFGASQGTSSVKFNGTTASVSSWSANSIAAAVPSGATSGPVTVTVAGTASNGVAFTVVPTATLSSRSPTSGAVTATVTLTGTNFGATQGSSVVKFNGTVAPVTTWSNTSITTSVPAGATTGQINVTVGGVTTSGLSFTVVPTATLTSLSPTSGAVGASVVVTGTNFGASKGSSTVTFNGTTAGTSSWTDTSFTATVPTGATSGPVVVTVGGVPTSGIAFTVVPTATLSTRSPTSGAVGTTVTLTGTNFGATQGSSSVAFNGTVAPVSAWSATSITTSVPTGATTGNIRVTVGGVTSNGLSFTVIPTPTISSIAPASSAVGASVVITGTNFGSTQGTSTVKFNTTTATVTSWSATSITATVPNVATGTANVTVTVGSLTSAATAFTVLPTATLSSVNPSSGAVGASVVLTGTNFGASQSSSIVKFGAVAATVTSWSATSVTATVPSGAGTPVTVTVGGVASGGVAFTLMPTATLSSLSPTSGIVGSTVTLTGTNFGASQGTSTVRFNGTLVTSIGAWSPTSIAAAVPTGATSGPVTVTVGGVATTGLAFAVTPSTPTLDALSPTSGAMGTAVTISGANFGSTQGTSVVQFNGTNAVVSSWSASSITAAVPGGATSGPVKVTVGSTPSNGVQFTVVPLVSGTLVVQDTFTAANGIALTSRTPDVSLSGNGWAWLSGSYTPPTINNNRLGSIYGSYRGWTVDSGIADATISADITGWGPRPWGAIIVRGVSEQNYLYAVLDGAPQLMRRNGGSAVEVARGTYPLLAGQQYRLEVRALGNQISVYTNGVFQFTYTDNDLVTATRHGVLWHDEDAGATFDNFEVRALSQVSTYTRVYDDFASASSQSLAGRAPLIAWQGSPWILYEGSWPTLSGGEVKSSSSADAYTLTSVDTGAPNGIVATDFRSTATTRRAGIALRIANAGNFLLLQYSGNWGNGRIDLWRRVNGALSLIRGVSVGPLDGTHRLEARLVGTSITALLDGAFLFETTSNDNQTSTRHGLLWSPNSDNSVHFDNFSVSTETPAPLLPAGTLCEPSLNRWTIQADSGNNTLNVDVTMPHSLCRWAARMVVPQPTSFASIVDGSVRVGSSTAQIRVTNNTDYYPRQAYASVAGRLVIVNQAGTDIGECQYTITPANLSFNGDGGTETVSVTPYYPSCSWVVSPDYRTPTASGWIGLSDGSLHDSGTTESFTVTVGKAPVEIAGSSRTAYLTIGMRTEYVVSQLGERCAFSVDRSAETVPSDATSFDVWVTSPPDCSWEAVSLSSFIHITENPTGNGHLNFRVSVENNPQPIGRIGHVEVRKAGYPSKTVTVTQCGTNGCTNGDPGGEVSYVQTDAIGSVRVITSGSGQVVARYDYTPFGTPWLEESQTQPDPNRVRFAGGERDKETQFGAWQSFEYFGARFYQSQTGRFTTPDSPGLDQFLGNPQSFNLYAYVRSNPSRYVDDTGNGALSLAAKAAFEAYRRRAVRQAWAAEQDMVVRTGQGTRAWSAKELKELAQTGKVKKYEGHHINSVAGKPLEMAGNPDNIAFMTRADHLKEHSGNWRTPTKGSLLNRGAFAAFLYRWDREERSLTSRESCGSLCASPDSFWSIINPWNNLLDTLALFRAFAPEPEVLTLKPDVTTTTCFGSGEACRK